MVVLVIRQCRHAVTSSIRASRFPKKSPAILFVWLTFLGAIIAMRERAHIRVDLLVRNLRPNLRWACTILAHLMVLGASVLFLQGSIEQTLVNLDNNAAGHRSFFGAGLWRRNHHLVGLHPHDRRDDLADGQRISLRGRCRPEP